MRRSVFHVLFSSGAVLLAMLWLTACGGGTSTPAPTEESSITEPTATPNVRPGGDDPTPTAIPPVTPNATVPIPTSTPTAAPAKVVDVEMRAMVFMFDKAAIPGGETFSFRAINTGDQAHEMALLQVNADVEALMAVLQDGSVDLKDIPEGLLLIERTGPVAPGEQVVLPIAGLAPGRYAMASLLPDEHDPDHVLQVFKGMVAEFRVQADS